MFVKRSDEAVKINELSEEKVREMSSMELAYMVLEEEGGASGYTRVMDRLTELKGYTEEQRKSRMIKLFTSMNLDGRFVHLGENHWGLRGWYPLDQSDEELSHTVQGSDELADEIDPEEETYDDDLVDISDDLDAISKKDDADEDTFDDNDLEGFEPGNTSAGFDEDEDEDEEDSGSDNTEESEEENR